MFDTDMSEDERLADAHILEISCNYISESKRYFLFFRPQEIVVGEDFRVEVHFKNIRSEREFPGGNFCVYISYNGGPQRNPRSLESIVIPNISPKGTVAVISDFKIKSHHVGTNYLYFFLIVDDGKKQMLFNDKKEHFYQIEDQWFPFHVSTKEEIYQYYGVWFAVAISFVALLLSIANTILSLIQFFGAR